MSSYCALCYWTRASLLRNRCDRRDERHTMRTARTSIVLYKLLKGFVRTVKSSATTLSPNQDRTVPRALLLTAALPRRSAQHVRPASLIFEYPQVDVRLR